jgi:hypothetical protein
LRRLRQRQCRAPVEAGGETGRLGGGDGAPEAEPDVPGAGGRAVCRPAAPWFAFVFVFVFAFAWACFAWAQRLQGLQRLRHKLQRRRLRRVGGNERNTNTPAPPSNRLRELQLLSQEKGRRWWRCEHERERGCVARQLPCCVLVLASASAVAIITILSRSNSRPKCLHLSLAKLWKAFAGAEDFIPCSQTPNVT